MDKLLVLYINLDNRTDRLAQITEELQVLKDFPCEIQRVPAIKDSYGPRGCSKSHMLAAETFLKSTADIVLVLEDDFTFVVDKTTIYDKLQHSIDMLQQHKADVILLTCCNGKNDIVEMTPIDHGLVRVKNMTCAVAYMYKKDYAPKIINIMKTAIDLVNNGQPHWVSSLDIVWRMYHSEDVWMVHMPDIGKQRPSYSDISLCEVAYETYYEIYYKNRINL